MFAHSTALIEGGRGWLTKGRTVNHLGGGFCSWVRVPGKHAPPRLTENAPQHRGRARDPPVPSVAPDGWRGTNVKREKKMEPMVGVRLNPYPDSVFSPSFLTTASGPRLHRPLGPPRHPGCKPGPSLYNSHFEGYCVAKYGKVVRMTYFSLHI